MSTSRLDGFGALVSASCAVHCVLAAVAPALLAGLGLLHSERAEWGLAGTAVVFGLLSAVIAYRKKRPLWLLLLFVSGVALVLFGRVAEEALGTGAIAIAGGVTLAVAHLLHIRMGATGCVSASAPSTDSNSHEPPAQSLAPGA